MWLVEPGIRLHYFAAGEGKPALVIHGGPGNPPVNPWSGLEPLEGDYRFYYYDQRGCGKSTRPFDTFASTNYYENMQALNKTPRPRRAGGGYRTHPPDPGRGEDHADRALLRRIYRRAVRGRVSGTGREADSDLAGRHAGHAAGKRRVVPARPGTAPRTGARGIRRVPQGLPELPEYIFEKRSRSDRDEQPAGRILPAGLSECPALRPEDGPAAGWSGGSTSAWASATITGRR